MSDMSDTRRIPGLNLGGCGNYQSDTRFSLRTTLHHHRMGGGAHGQVRGEQREAVLACEEGEWQVLEVPHDTQSVSHVPAAIR